jgi:hypothetical protein
MVKAIWFPDFKESRVRLNLKPTILPDFTLKIVNHTPSGSGNSGFKDSLNSDGDGFQIGY